MNRIGIIGAGAFGTALGCALARDAKHQVVIWGRDPLAMARMQETRCNRRYLAQIGLPAGLTATADLAEMQKVAALLLVLPAQQLDGFLAENRHRLPDCPTVLCAKGIETGTGRLQSEILAARGGVGPIAILSGPGFAAEIAAGKPTALSLACAEPVAGTELQHMLSGTSLRLYLTQDITGVQLGGALKNVYAIACGLAAGAGLGESARAALMTRGFAEMALLAQRMGAQSDTLAGLSGLGDLALTCGSLQSRNFAFGEALGRHNSFDKTRTVEGIATAQALMALAKAQNVDMPVARAVADILSGALTLDQALKALMARPLKQEAGPVSYSANPDGSGSGTPDPKQG